MNCTIEDMTSFNQIMLGELHYATSEALSAAGVDPQIICSLAPLFRDDGQFGHPFGGLETTYQQIKYFRKHFNFIVGYGLWYIPIPLHHISHGFLYYDPEVYDFHTLTGICRAVLTAGSLTGLCML